MEKNTMRDKVTVVVTKYWNKETMVIDGYFKDVMIKRTGRLHLTPQDIAYLKQSALDIVYIYK